MARAPAEQLEQCVDALYQSLTDPGAFPSAIHSLRHLFGATGATYINLSRKGEIRAFVDDGHDPQWVARMLADPTHTLFALTAAGAAMDALHIAVCVVDAESRLLYVSPAAEGLLASQQTLRVTDGRLCSRRTPVNDTLRRAIARATRPPRQPSAFSPEPDAPASARLQVRTLPLAAGVRLAQYVDGTRDHGHLALVFVATGAPSPQPHELEQLFGLTRSEAELVGLLARALSPAACAKRRGVSVATVRTQMASVYAKTGVESQTQLLRLVLALPPLR